MWQYVVCKDLQNNQQLEELESLFVCSLGEDALNIHDEARLHKSAQGCKTLICSTEALIGPSTTLILPTEIPHTRYDIISSLEEVLICSRERCVLLITIQNMKMAMWPPCVTVLISALPRQFCDDEGESHM